MNKLGQLLVARGWITVQQLNRALQNQGVVGGRVGTCLLEMEAISEDNLLKGLSEHMGVPAVSLDDLRGIPDEVLALIPDKIARRCRAVPFRVVGSRLDVAMVDPRNLAALDEIAFASGKRINVHVANELRILEALERFYRDEMPSRLALLAERMNRARYFWERDKPAEPEMPRGLGDVELAPLGPLLEAGPPRRTRVAPAPAPPPPPPVRPAPAAPAQVRPAAPAPPVAPAAETPAVRPAPPRPAMQTVTMTEEERAALGRPQPSARPAVSAGGAASPEAPPAKPTPPSLPSPGSAEEVEAALGKTLDREEVARLVLGFVARSYSRAALFQVAKDRISAWMGQGEMDLPIFQKFSVGFDQPSLFLNLRQGSSLYLGPLPPMPAHRELARAWGGELPKDCILLPVRVKDRLVAILYADGGLKSGKGIGGIGLPQLQAVAAAAGAALERCILHRKRAEAK